MENRASIKITTKSWHFRLMQYVLGDVAPTAENMHNLCPYFWLLIFALLISPVFIPIKLVSSGISKIIRLIGDIIYDTTIIPTAKKWEDSLTDFEVYSIYNHDIEVSKFWNKMYQYENDGDTIYRNDFVRDWWEKKYEKSSYHHDGSWTGNSDEFNNWIDENAKKRDELLEETNTITQKRKQFKKSFSEKSSCVIGNIDNLYNKLSNYMSKWTNIIKWTKRFVGLAITTIGLIATFFIVNFLGRGVLWIIDNITMEFSLTMLYVIIGFGILVITTVVLSRWMDYMKEHGTKLWYVKILYVLTRYIIYWPLRIIFYDVLWNFVIINIVLGIIAIAKITWGTIIGFSGIFGEYAGASYSDYCPGLDIIDIDDEAANIDPIPDTISDSTNSTK